MSLIVQARTVFEFVLHHWEILYFTSYHVRNL